MKKIRDYSFLIAAIVLLSLIIYYGWVGYFIVEVKGNEMVDGWGRTMYEPPAFLTVWGLDEWRGYKWSGIDAVIFTVTLLMVFHGFDRYKNRHKYK